MKAAELLDAAEHMLAMETAGTATEEASLCSVKAIGGGGAVQFAAVSARSGHRVATCGAAKCL
jgi:hypothetical protein